jgi:hypothetical protein
MFTGLKQTAGLVWHGMTQVKLRSAQNFTLRLVNGSVLQAMTFTMPFVTLNTMPIRIGTMTLKAGAKRLQVTSKLN